MRASTAKGGPFPWKKKPFFFAVFTELHYFMQFLLGFFHPGLHSIEGYGSLFGREQRARLRPKTHGLIVGALAERINENSSRRRSGVKADQQAAPLMPDSLHIYFYHDRVSCR